MQHSRVLNCTNCTKASKASHIVVIFIRGLVCEEIIFPRGFCQCREILELKNDTSILRKIGSLANKTLTLIVLFLKTKIYFYRFNSGNKQINRNF